MKKKIANQIAKKWNEDMTSRYALTRTKALVCKKGLRQDYAVEILPDGENDGSSFHHLEELVLVEKYYEVHAYVTYLKQGVSARIF